MVPIWSARARSGAPLLALSLTVPLLQGCAAVGSMMSPYSEKFSCKNDDHGQCIHPERAYEDAVAGAVSKSDPRVTTGAAKAANTAARRKGAATVGYEGYRDSVYRELKGLIDEPVTPMLKPARTVRTLILPYADRTRPDRLYMPRYVYSVLDRPVWVVGGTLVRSPGAAVHAPVLGQVKEPAAAPAGGEPQPSNGERDQ
jgi:conjugal transfer pilus assembly protein TraV